MRTLLPWLAALATRPSLVASWALLAAALGGAACGPAPGLPVGLELRLDALAGDEVLQFVVVAGEDVDRAPVTCSDVVPACVAAQRDRLRIVPLRLDTGEALAWRVPLDLEAARSAEGQALVVPGIPAGRGYLLVVEVLEAGRRVAAGCTPVEVVTPGDNPPLEEPVVVEPATACDARLD